MKTGGGIVIPVGDLELINKSFKNSRTAQAILKNASGNRMTARVKEINRTSFILENFGGRILKQNKSVIPKDGKQVLVGKKGQLFDSIPEELRSEVVWSESDFE